MAHIADELVQIVEDAAGSLRSISESEAGMKPEPNRWTKKEVMGHLIDSAANNHQRFVRGQQVVELVLPAYEQEKWVSIQDYNNSPWLELIELWRFYNLHLAHVIRRMPAEKLAVVCKIGSNQPVPLGHIVDDYLRHLKHHLGKIGAV
jgi:hypothetical protein